MTIHEVLEHLCVTVALVYRSQGDYSEASDGFCKRCRKDRRGWDDFQHKGNTLRYVRQAVLEKLKRDGITVAEGFDPVTGDDLRRGRDDDSLPEACAKVGKLRTL